MARCRSCRSPQGEIVLDLGGQPPCEYFPPLADDRPDELFPLRLWLCAHCGLAQLADDADVPERPEGIEPAALAAQRAQAVAAVREAGLLAARSTVVEAPSPHGGSWLPLLAAEGIREAAPGELADLVVDASFGMMHAADQSAALDALVARLADDGVLLFGFHSLGAIVEHRQWNAIRHGHYAYYSTQVLVGMFAERGVTATHAWSFPLYGGTVVLAARRGGEPGASVAAAVAAEDAVGVRDAVAVGALARAVESSTSDLRALLREAADRGERVYGYSAASRAVALLHAAGVDADRLVAVGDASPRKQGCRMPGGRIPVVSPAEMVAARPDRVLLFVPDLIDEVRAAMPGIDASRWVLM